MIQDTIFALPHADAAKTILTPRAPHTIFEVRGAQIAENGEFNIRAVETAASNTIHLLAVKTEGVDVHTVLCLLEPDTMGAILKLHTIEATFAVTTVVNEIPGGVFNLYPADGGLRKSSDKS